MKRNSVWFLIIFPKLQLLVFCNFPRGDKMKTSSFLLFDGFEHEEIIPPTSLLQWSFLVFYPSTVLDSVGLGTDMDGHTHTHKL